MFGQSARWNRIRYRLYAPVYDSIAKPLERGRQEAIESLELEPGQKLLIVGCGTGLDLDYVPKGVDVTAIDVTPEMVRRTQARAERLGHDVDVRVTDARSLSFDDDEFDAGTLHLLLAVVPDPKAVVDEVSRVLAPDGSVSLFDKFLREGETVSLPRRALNPVARLLFSDLTRRLDPLFADTDLTVEVRDTVLRGLYTIAIARRQSEP